MFLAVAALTVVVVACEDEITAPRGRPRLAPSAASHDASVGDSPDEVVVVLPEADSTYGSSGLPPGDSVGSYPHWTALRVTAQGYHVRTPLYSELGGAENYGPNGNAGYSWWYNSQNTNRTIGSGGSSADTAARYDLVRGTIYAAYRAGYGARNISGYHNYIYCGPQYGNLCDRWSGTTTITFTRLQSDLSLTATPGNGLPGDTVLFQFGASPKVVEGQSMPFEVDSTQWIPDADTAGGDPSEQPAHAGGKGACQAATDSTCRRVIVGSGMFVMSAWVNGKRITKSVHVAAPTLMLDASPSPVHPGDSVTFTPSWSDGQPVTTVTSWTWVADMGAAHAPSCGTATPCVGAIRESGWMQVFVQRGGLGRSALAHVATLARRRLRLDPQDTVWVWRGDSVHFVASASDGASLHDIRWSSEDPIVAARTLRAERPRARRFDAGGVGSTTCGDDVAECTDVAVAEYTRIVSAIVDDSLQWASTIVVTVDSAELDSLASAMPTENPNPKEAAWCLARLLSGTCGIAKSLADTALKFAYDSAVAHDSLPVDNRFDAWRHALWSALMTREFDVQTAKAIGDNHEYGQIDSPVSIVHEAACMDLTNNERGRSIATAHPGSSNTQFKGLVAQAQNLQHTPFSCNFTRPW